MRVRSRLAALASVSALAATGVALAPGSASAAVFVQKCPTFRVVARDTRAGFPQAGVYRRNAFSNSRATIPSCNETYHVLRSWLYDPDRVEFAEQGWDVGALRGGLRTRTGRQFAERGSNGRSGFQVYR
jgi:hypothetical protein